MKKAMRRLLAMCVALLLLGGCAKKSSLADEYGYKYYESNGKHYITMSDITPKDMPNGASVSVNKFYFQDFREMIFDIQTGNFTELEFIKLKDNLTYWYQSATLVTVDLDNLLQPVYPERYELKNIYWSGAEDYHIALQNESGSSGVGVSFGNNDLDYDRVSRYVNPEYYIENAESSSYPFTVEYEDDRNATVLKKYEQGPYNYEEKEHRLGDLRSATRCYSFTKDNAIYYVHEFYKGKEEKLHSIDLLVVEGDEWAFFSIEDLNERPSIEFLSQFGFEPYKG